MEKVEGLLPGASFPVWVASELTGRPYRVEVTLGEDGGLSCGEERHDWPGVGATPRAAVLLPMSAIASGCGPTNSFPFLASSSAASRNLAAC